jgi:hypothetical protein
LALAYKLPVTPIPPLTVNAPVMLLVLVAPELTITLAKVTVWLSEALASNDV